MSSDELIQQEVKLPASIEKNISNPEDFYKTAFEFQQIMMIYESAIKQLQTKLDILNKENKISGRRNPIETVKSRIKSPQSIAGKLQKKQLPITFESMQKNLNDIAGVRVICSFPEDIYLLADCLLQQDDVTLIEIKDYIKKPKESGYRSLHLIIEVPIFLQNEKKNMKVEVQLRTIAMDFWASLEHKLRYKKNIPQQEADVLAEELVECAKISAELDSRMEQIRNRIVQNS